MYKTSNFLKSLMSREEPADQCLFLWDLLRACPCLQWSFISDILRVQLTVCGRMDKYGQWCAAGEKTTKVELKLQIQLPRSPDKLALGISTLFFHLIMLSSTGRLYVQSALRSWHACDAYIHSAVCWGEAILPLPQHSAPALDYLAMSDVGGCYHRIGDYQTLCQFQGQGSCADKIGYHGLTLNILA